MSTGTPFPGTAAAGPPPPAPRPPYPPLRRYYSGEAEHRRRIDGWFDGAAADYDWITQVMSFGFGHWYRRRGLLRAGLGSGMSGLGLGCGSGVPGAPPQRPGGGARRVSALA